MSTAVTTPKFVDIPDREYFSSPAMSRTELWSSHQSLSQYKHDYIDGNADSFTATTAMDVGSVAHAVVLLRQKISEVCSVYPSVAIDPDSGEEIKPLKSNGAINPKGAARYRQIISSNWTHEHGPLFLKQSDYERVESIVESCRNHTHLYSWVHHENSANEHAIFWRDEITNIDLRCKPDCLVIQPNSITALDLKITAHWRPESFRRRMKDSGYWMQQAMYTDGIESYFKRRVDWYFVCVNPDPPHQITVIGIDVDSSVEASNKYRIALNRVAEALIDDQWQDDCEKKVTYVSLHPRDFGE